MIPSPAPGDPLLGRARRSITRGELPAELREAITTSEQPAHARARRLLVAMAEPPPGQAPPAPATTPVVPRLATSDPPAEAGPPPTPVPPPAAAAADAPAQPARPSSPAAAARPTIERVALAPARGGGVLTIQADAGVLVGVASQPSSSVVRLVLDGAAATPKVLSARPSIRGARVTAIDRGPTSVRITLALDDGWRFGGVRRTARGARVDLVGP